MVQMISMITAVSSAHRPMARTLPCFSDEPPELPPLAVLWFHIITVHGVLIIQQTDRINLIFIIKRCYLYRISLFYNQHILKKRIGPLSPIYEIYIQHLINTGRPGCFVYEKYQKRISAMTDIKKVRLTETVSGAG